MGAVRTLNEVLAKIDRKVDLRKFNAWTRSHGIPFYIAPISHWYVDLRWQFEGLLGISELWYPWGRFEKRYKDVYVPTRWGGWFLIFEFGSRG